MSQTDEPGPWTHIKATEHHGHFIEDQFGNTVCDLYTMQGSCHPFENAEQHAEFIAAAPETAAERDQLLAENAELIKALDAVPLYTESCHGIGGRWLCLHCDRRCENPHALLHKSDCFVPMIQAVIAKAKESTS